MNDGYIAILDSGIGGVSVLLELIKLLPNERYLYFGDNHNAPYGNKSLSQLLRITEKNIDYIKQYKQILCGESFYNGNFEGACAGTIESSDAYVGIEPNSELNIQIESIVKNSLGTK